MADFGMYELRVFDLKLTRTKAWLKRLAVVAGCAVLLLVVVLAVCWFAFPFPLEKIERLPRSPIVTDRNGRVMLDLVGSDDQWRIPITLSEMSPWLIQATIAVEDERFRSHPGVDPVAVCRAIGQNISSGRVVSGASTITMQVCRMLDERPRTFTAKLIESFRAIQLEQLKNKDEILALYLNLAPYGGNLRGVEAASLAYFGKSAKHLSLGEAALLAGLPQSPERHRPDRHGRNATARRDTVLNRMVEAEFITAVQAEEASLQPLVVQPRSRERSPFAMQAAWVAFREKPMGGQTTIDLEVQDRVASLARTHIESLPEKSNAAVVVIDISSAEILAMVGSARVDDPIEGQVNGALARRSPGSTLKPFVYAAAMDAGRLNRESVLYDGPIERDGWTPGNFDGEFSGEVRVEAALKQSLNVPAILVAEAVGLNRCIGVMRSVGVNLPAHSSQRGGLAAVVGSIETDLLSLTNAYATLGRGGVVSVPRLFLESPKSSDGPVLQPAVCAAINDMLSSMKRRPKGMEQVLADELPWFMWKTGTSSGRRDAWAVGHNGRIAIGVWIGRFDGSGHTAYVGVEAAEPLLARLFDEPRWCRTDRPDATTPLPVHRPLPPAREQMAELRITSPVNGSTFVAAGTRSPMRFASNQADVSWFLNGKRLGESVIHPSAGRYRLICTNDLGESSAVQFEVK